MNYVQRTSILRASELAASIVAKRETITESDLRTTLIEALENHTRALLVEFTQAISAHDSETARLGRELKEARDRAIQMERELERSVRVFEHARAEIEAWRDAAAGALAAHDPRYLPDMPRPRVEPSSAPSTACDGSGRFLANVINPSTRTLERQLVACFGCERCRPERTVHHG